MYKILILKMNTSATTQMYYFYTNVDGTVFATDDLTTLSSKCRELLDTNPVPQIIPIDELTMSIVVDIID